MTESLRIVELQEHTPLRLSPQAIARDRAVLLWEEYDRERGILRVDFPSPRTDNQWQITPRGWVGHLPLAPDLFFHLRPKVPVGNLFHMLAYAYSLQSFITPEGVTGTESTVGLFQRLAELLARGVLERGRQGFHRAYLPREERLPYVRGRLDLRRQRPWTPAVPCRYEEQTIDIADNQILAWTLRQIALSKLCDEPTDQVVRRAHRSLHGRVSSVRFGAEACVGRNYTRLNRDYHRLHALCHFLLEHSGPGHRLGEHTMIPFLVNMERLYEQFVARWLEIHLPRPWRVAAQEQVKVGRRDELRFNVDLVLYGREDRARLVLDTKYKRAELPAPADVQQIMTYARLRDCREAVLVYPQVPGRALDVEVGGVRLRMLPFALEGDLEAQGRAFLQALLPGRGA